MGSQNIIGGENNFIKSIDWNKKISESLHICERPDWVPGGWNDKTISLIHDTRARARARRDNICCLPIVKVDTNIMGGAHYINNNT